MKVVIGLTILALVALSSAVNFDEVLPIQQKFLRNPEKYPIYAKYAQEQKSGTGDRQGRITGGNEAARGQFPYQAAMFVTASGGTYFCGGTILDTKTILTAAHCVDDVKSMEIITGAHLVREQEPSQQRVKFDYSPDLIIVHEAWSPTTIRNDVAIVKLPTFLRFVDRVQPILLPRQRDLGETFATYTGTSSGWGKDRDNSTGISPVLRWVQSDIITNSACNIYFVGQISAGNICASGSGGKSVCSGDSGGPIVVTHNDEVIQVGISSFVSGLGCERGFPGAYSRVSYFIDWISDKSGIPVRN